MTSGPLVVVQKILVYSGIFAWDILLSLLNLVSFKRPVGKVTPEGCPGYGGHWPEYRPPQEGESRCSCPGLNAMANHGIIARSGRDLKFADLRRQIHSTYNFSPSFCSFITHYTAFMLNKSYGKDTVNLEEIDLHNGIEHDASLTRLDTALQPIQGVKHIPFIDELLSIASGKDSEGHPLLTVGDLSRILGKRRVQARRSNKDYSLSSLHKLFGSANTSTLPTIFGSRVEDLRTILLDERLPEGWESRVREPHGLTIMALNRTVLPCEWGIREADWESHFNDDGTPVV